MRMALPFAAAIALIGGIGPAHADQILDLTHVIAKDWAQIEYRTPADQQSPRLTELAAQADAIVARAPDRAEAIMWDGIVTTSLATLEGPPRGLALAHKARGLFEHEEIIEKGKAGGSAHLWLGALYDSVAGWPGGFGDPGKARTELMEGLRADPQDIDAAYFWGRFLYHQGRNADALRSLRASLRLPLRAGRKVADAGRREEAGKLIEVMQAKIKPRQPNRPNRSPPHGPVD